jgi:hypothetical protein
LKLLFTQDALVNAGAERSHLDILSRFSKEIDVGFVYFSSVVGVSTDHFQNLFMTMRSPQSIIRTKA